MQEIYKNFNNQMRIITNLNVKISLIEWKRRKFTSAIIFTLILNGNIFGENDYWMIVFIILKIVVVIILWRNVLEKKLITENFGISKE